MSNNTSVNTTRKLFFLHLECWHSCWSVRSFEPILRLLPQSIAPVSQHWATWALFNLVSVYRESPLCSVFTSSEVLSPHLQLVDNTYIVQQYTKSISLHLTLFHSEQVLSSSDKGRRSNSSRESSGAGQLKARDKGHGQVRLQAVFVCIVFRALSLLFFFISQDQLCSCWLMRVEQQRKN